MPLIDSKEYVRTLGKYHAALKTMKSELSSYGMSVPQLMSTLAERSEDFDLFAVLTVCIKEKGPMAFSDGWRHYVSCHSNCLAEREVAALLWLGDIIGRYTIEEQIAAIDSTLNVLRTGIEETEKRIHETTRLYIGTSLSLSIMLVVMLL